MEAVLERPEAQTTPPPPKHLSLVVNNVPKLAVPTENVYVTFDLETTGLYAWKNGIVQIGAVAANEFGEVLDVFKKTCYPGKVEVTEEAMNVHKIPWDVIERSEPVAQAVNSYIKFLDDVTKNKELIHLAWPPKFDSIFVEKVVEEYGFDNKAFRRVYCVMSMFFQYMGFGKKYKLDEAATYFGITSKGAHDALEDAVVTSKIFFAMKNNDKPTGGATFLKAA